MMLVPPTGYFQLRLEAAALAVNREQKLLRWEPWRWDTEKVDSNNLAVVASFGKVGNTLAVRIDDLVGTEQHEWHAPVSVIKVSQSSAAKGKRGGEREYLGRSY